MKKIAKLAFRIISKLSEITTISRENSLKLDKIIEILESQNDSK